MTLLCPENSLKSKVAHAHTKTTVGEEVHCCYKKFVAGLEQKKGAIAAFFQPITTAFRELLNLRLCQSERIKANLKTAKHILEGAIFNHFVDFERECLYSAAQRRHNANGENWNQYI